MKKSLVALAMGPFALGFSEFVMMGVLALVAADLGVSVPDAGSFISAYAVGVCVGTLILVLGRRVPPRTLLVGLILLCAVGNALAAIAPTPSMLVLGRFVSGLPHGAFFGTATLAAKMLADPGKEGQAVSGMVLGQTIANTIGVPGGTLIAGLISWRAVFGFVAVWAVVSALAILRFIPRLDPIPDAGLAGQFAFLKKPAPWLIIGGVLLGNTGIFCWWSYVSPWLASIGGFPEATIPACLVLAGLGMVIGVQLGGRLGDRTSPGAMAVAGQGIAGAALLMIALTTGSPVVAAALMFLCAFGMFFVSSPQQILMVEVGQGGGELLAGACVQIAFNGGNALGAMVGQTVLNAGAAYNWVGLAGVPFSILAAVLLAVFTIRYERQYHLEATARVN